MNQETIFAQHQQWCVHYKREPGSPNREACEAGVIYDDLARVAELGRTGCALRLPCIRSHHDPTKRRGEPLCECPHLRWPTIEESQAHEAETRRYIDRFMLAQEVISEVKKEHRGKDWRGTKECPICKGVLHMTHAAFNGHVWGQCETKDCLSWME